MGGVTLQSKTQSERAIGIAIWKHLMIQWDMSHIEVMVCGSTRVRSRGGFITWSACLQLQYGAFV